MVAAALLGPVAAHAQAPAVSGEEERYVSVNDLGGVGLMQTRTARFGPDGLFNFGYSRVEPYKRIFLTVHVFPWMEATFRYTEIENRLYSSFPNFSGFQTFKDRGADLKFQLMSESRYLPAVAMGVQDFVGTGQFAGEYVVGSKRIGDFDVSLGMGWGYLGSAGAISNPLASVWSVFGTRTTPGSGGGLPATNIFRGPTVGLFGGVEYRTPLEGVTLQVEYDGIDYREEPLGGNVQSTSPLNFGLNFRPYPGIDFGYALERGNAHMFRVSLRTELHEPGVTKFDPPPPAVAEVRPTVGQLTSAGGNEAPAPAVAPQSAGSLGAAPGGPDADPFSVLETFGLRVEQFELRGSEALVQVAAAGGLVTLAAAAAALTMLPADVAALTLSSAGVPAVRAVRGSDAPYYFLAPEPSPAAVATGGAEYLLPPEDPAYTREQVRAIGERMAVGLGQAGVYMETLTIEGRFATVAVTSARYRETARNMGAALRAIVNYLPAPVEAITLVMLNGGMEMSRFTFLRSEVEREARLLGSPEEILARGILEPGAPGRPDGLRFGRIPRFSGSAEPRMRQHIGNPDQFYLYQFWLAFYGALDVAPGLSLHATLGANLYHNFDRIRLASDSVLPHVRSDILDYLQQGENNIVTMEATYFAKLDQDIYVRFSAGLFEEMFGGIGAEVLYRPFNSRLALGLEIDRVRQRDYDQLFSFRDYTVNTGHVSAYYQLPVYDALASLHVGQYLAGDRGATFELSRRFGGGVRVGAWATLTDVPFAKFGEGSFDKGFFIVIPLDLFTTQSSTAAEVFAFRPLYRDGGQRLVVGDRLYDVTWAGTSDEITRDWPRLFQ